MHNFYEIFNRNRSEYGIHKITNAGIQAIRDFTTPMIASKSKESRYQLDGGQKAKRMNTGFLGEKALEEYVGKNFTDLSVGQSKNYTVPDLIQLDMRIGVKTVEMGKFHLIPKNPTHPEIILVKTGDLFYILGVASVQTLEMFQDDQLILSPNCKGLDRKSAFYGLDQLVPFQNFEELKQIAVTMGAYGKAPRKQFYFI